MSTHSGDKLLYAGIIIFSWLLYITYFSFISEGIQPVYPPIYYNFPVYRNANDLEDGNVGDQNPFRDRAFMNESSRDQSNVFNSSLASAGHQRLSKKRNYLGNGKEEWDFNSESEDEMLLLSDWDVETQPTRNMV